ncbi:MAG: DNA cytosine methyltransferase [Kiritimatiellaeota bacterium]|nr:DNA cytosine methyltransferase [Kiritimatiellota bacterium]
MNYYNEIDPFAAEWLRQLIRLGELPEGVVDERSIEDVRPTDLNGFKQCHFFAGVGGFPLALRRAGVPDDHPVWTGSCPCQGWSDAGLQKGFEDERDLWPAFFNLIMERRPSCAIGEQVDGAIRFGWFDRLSDDLEAIGYTVGAVVMGAHSAGAPHIRQRLYWSAHRLPHPQHDGHPPPDGLRDPPEPPLTPRAHGVREPAGGGGADGLAHTDGERRETAEGGSLRGRLEPVPPSPARGLPNPDGLRHEGGGGAEQGGQTLPLGGGHADGGLEDTRRLRRGGGCAGHDPGHQPPLPPARHGGDVGLVIPDGIGRRGRDQGPEGREHLRAAPEGRLPAGGDVNAWRNVVGAYCLDHKVRPFEPGILPLVARLPRGMGHGGDPRSPQYANNTAEAFAMRLKGYGNAINIGTATLYIRALIEEGLLCSEVTFNAFDDDDG